ncbi:hypothetical protein GF336_03645 [Candidatus Woesearchaeota archaeon]|nr:hypothetical protein [Candidatus Woesearchaeota archaeon]
MGEPFLYDVVDKLYNSVMDHMPQALQDRDMASAFVLGTVGIYSVVKGLQWTSKNVMNKIISNFDEKWLPNLEKACTLGMAVAPVLYAAIDPEGAKEIMTQHPTYTSGMAGVYAGSITGAVQDLHRRSKQTLDESL